VGVDDYAGSNGSVLFQVWTDGEKAFESGLMSGSSPTQPVDVDLTGVHELTLLIPFPGIGGINSDYADWADAKLTPAEGGRWFSEGSRERSVGVPASGSGKTRQHHSDALGTEVALTDGSQAIETRYQTDAWGNVLSGNAADNASVWLGGSGYWYEPLLGSYYVRPGCCCQIARTYLLLGVRRA
jgi:hypothetical protein